MVSGIPITEGELVQPGQVLVQFDPEVNAERLRSLSRQKELESQRLAEETQAFQARTDSLQSKLASLKLTLATEQSIVNRMEGLMAQGAIAEVQYLQQKNRLQELQSEIAQTGATLREVEAESIKSKQQIQRELADLERQLVETNKSKEYESLRAPVKGYVFDLIPSSPAMPPAAAKPCSRSFPTERWRRRCSSVMPMWDSCAPRCRPKSGLMPTPSPNTATFPVCSNALASSP